MYLEPLSSGKNGGTALFLCSSAFQLLHAQTGYLVRSLLCCGTLLFLHLEACSRSMHNKRLVNLEIDNVMCQEKREQRDSIHSLPLVFAGLGDQSIAGSIFLAYCSQMADHHVRRGVSIAYKTLMGCPRVSRSHQGGLCGEQLGAENWTFFPGLSIWFSSLQSLMKAKRAAKEKTGAGTERRFSRASADQVLAVQPRSSLLHKTKNNLPDISASTINNHSTQATQYWNIV